MWRLTALQVEPGIVQVQVWRSGVWQATALGPSVRIAASRARRSAKHFNAAEPWCRIFAEKCIQAAYANGRKGWWAV